jgi:hypothetical protein
MGVLGRQIVLRVRRRADRVGQRVREVALVDEAGAPF